MKRYEAAASALVVAAFATIWTIALIINGPPEFPQQYVTTLSLMGVLATIWVIAVRLLVRAWWSLAGHELSTMDGPARLLAVAVATLPADRADWRVAMPRELAQVTGRATRWRFALGCARTAVLPPRRRRLLLPVGALVTGTVIIVGLAVGDAMRLFAVTFAALAGVMIVFAVARSRAVSRPVSGPVVVAMVLAAVAGCIAVTAYALGEDPRGGALPASAAVFLAAVLAVGCWLALAAPLALASDRRARAVAVGAAVLIAGGLVLEAHTVRYGVLVSLFLAPVVIFFVASATVAAAGRSFRAGVQAAVWTVLLSVLTVFPVGLLEALRWYRRDRSLLLDGDYAGTFGVNINDFVFLLALLPLWWLPFGVMGAAVGSRRWGRPSHLRT